MGGLLIIGCMDQARIMGDFAVRCGLYDDIAFIGGEDAPESLLGLPVLREDEQDFARLRERFKCAIAAMGNNAARLRNTRLFLSRGFDMPPIIHPQALVHPTATIGRGTFVAARAYVGQWATVGEGCLINTGAIVEHDCTLADGVHISPGAAMGGGVSIGECTWVCVGAGIANTVSIGAHSVVGLGAAVLSNFGDHVLAAGVPATVKKRYDQARDA